ncbi:MAG: DegQ family serine endoprotease [Pseudomonadota bacterium]
MDTSPKTPESPGRKRDRRRWLAGIAAAGVLAAFAASSSFKCEGASPTGTPSATVEHADFHTPASFSQLAEKVSPAVVNISASKVVKSGPAFRHFSSPFGEEDPFQDFFGRFFGEQQPQQELRQHSLGSGFVIDQQGYILTNNHVVEKAEAIEVKLPSGATYEAKVVGKDPKMDLALIKIKPEKPLPVLKLGESANAEVGSWVLAIGNPFGLGGTVTQGIISATGRVIGAGPYDNFLQTDASINPGNSGGPLVNMAGEVIGINTAIVAGGQGIGFAIPVDMAKDVLPQLKEKGFVTRGWMGVAVQEVTPELARSFELKEPHGALVAEVTPNGPAAKAGIEPGDIIARFNDTPIKDMSELPRAVAMTPIGKKVAVTVLRNGTEKSFNVEVGELKDKTAPLGERETTGDLGMNVRDLTPQLARRLDLPPYEKGVVVTDVDGGGLAAEAGIQPGDVIRQVNRKPVDSTGEYEKLVSKLGPGDTALFLIQRGGTASFRAITIPGR